MSEQYECTPEVLDARLVMCQPQDNNALKWLTALLIVLIDQQDDPEGVVFTIQGHQIRFTYEGESEEEPED